MEGESLREEKRTRTGKKRESESGIEEREGSDMGWGLQGVKELTAQSGARGEGRVVWKSLLLIIHSSVLQFNKKLYRIPGSKATKNVLVSVVVKNNTASRKGRLMSPSWYILSEFYTDGKCTQKNIKLLQCLSGTSKEQVKTYY